MARICTCGRYLGSRTVCECGRVADDLDGGGDAYPGAAWLDDPADNYPFDPDPAALESADPRDAPPSPVPPQAGWGGLRGRVVDGEQQRLGNAGGVTAIRLLIVGVLAVVALMKGPQIAETITNAAISLMLIYLGPILIVVIALALLSRIPGMTGCLGALFRAVSFSWLLGRGRTEAPDGWTLVVETASGSVECRLAANAPFNGDEEVVVHGPSFGGVKHAWLLQCLSPRPFTRIGRGLLGLLATLLVVAPLVILMLTYL